MPLAGPRGAVGVLAIVPADGHAFESPEALHQLETFANQTALAIERAQLADEARQAEVRAETERMRNSLLSSVSHDLRTPLSTIIGASSGLLDGAERLDADTRRDLVRSIHGEASHLDRLVNSLLEMTRLESGAVTIRKEPQALDGVLGAALQRLEALLRDRPVGRRSACRSPARAHRRGAGRAGASQSPGQCDAVLRRGQPDRLSAKVGGSRSWWR